MVSAIDEMLITQRGRELGYKMGDEQFNSVLENIKKDNKIESDEQFQTALKAENMQNDIAIQPVIEGYGVFPMPIGDKGVAMVDARDIADVAVAELLRRDRAAEPLPRLTLDVAGAEVVTGRSAAAVWSDVLGRPVAYPGDDVAAFEAQLMQNHTPAWMAYDLRLMMSGIQQHGQLPQAGAVARLEQILGRKLRTYRDFVAERVTA